MKKAALLCLLLVVTACGTAVPPQPTSTPSPTETSTPVPTPTVTPTATPVPDGPCDNPLVPLGAGQTWQYRVTTPGGESLYTLKSLDVRDIGNIVAEVEFTDHKNDATLRELVVCQQGAIQNFPLYLMSMFFADYLDRILDTVHDTGTYAPAYPTLTGQDWAMDWQAVYLTENAAYLTNPLGGPDIFILESFPVSLAFQTDGSRETLTTPAGTFEQALVVRQSFSLMVSVTDPGSGTGTPGKLTVQTTQWYEPYVGLVKGRIDSVLLATINAEYNAPIESTLELIGYVPGD
jgi:hypothetical protein